MSKSNLKGRKKLSIKKTIISVLTYFNLFFIFTTFVIESEYIKYIGLSLGIILYVLIFLTIKEKRKKNLLFIYFMLFLLVSGSINFLFTSNLNFNGYLLNILHSGSVALGLLIYPPSYKLAKIIFSMIAAFFSFHIIQSNDPNMILLSSQNYISVVLILALGLMYIAADGENSKINYLPIIVSTFISIWAKGRTGIISILILLICRLLVDIKSKDKRENIKVIFLITLLLFTIIYVFIPQSEMIFSNFHTKNMAHDPRFDIWTEYLEKAFTSIGDFIYGVSYSELYLLRSYGHLHNSFLNLHAIYGLTAVIIILLLIFYNLIIILKNRKYLLASFVLVFLLRSSTDIVFTHIYYGTFLFYYFLFYAFFSLNKSKLNITDNINIDNINN